jgi:hypothetical protein
MRIAAACVASTCDCSKRAAPDMLNSRGRGATLQPSPPPPCAAQRSSIHAARAVY